MLYVGPDVSSPVRRTSLNPSCPSPRGAAFSCRHHFRVSGELRKRPPHGQSRLLPLEQVCSFPSRGHVREGWVCAVQPRNPGPAARTPIALAGRDRAERGCGSLLSPHHTPHCTAGSDRLSFAPQGRLAFVPTLAHTLCQHGCGAPWQPGQAGRPSFPRSGAASPR